MGGFHPSGGGGGVSGMSLIATQTLSSPAASFDFTGIPGGFIDLMVLGTVLDSTNAANANALVRFNGDSGSHYYYLDPLFNSTGLTNGNAGPTSSIAMTNVAASPAGNHTGITSFKLLVPGFSKTVLNKGVILDYTLSAATLSATSTGEYRVAAIWAQTAAITEVAIIAAATWVAGSTVSVYGLG